MNRDDQDRIFSYLITSAKGCIDEPPLYGPLRLLDAYSILLGMQKREDTDEFYFELGKQIESFKNKCMGDEKQFIEGLDQALESLTNYIIYK
ncbi:MAG: hypothetical protein APF77_07330 [Clostridia bacterium BRH_c25]|nr:MAG: hypothetical protein APF77_07330 [Clostridia bacterium BRH_c25]